MAIRTTVNPSLAGTMRASTIERYGWVLLALLGVVLTAFGAMAFLGDPGRDTPITGSQCCNGLSFSSVDAWAYEYAGEIARYMATYMLAAGVLTLLIVLIPLRRHERWAWLALCYLPVLFLVHGAVLGSFPFDYVPLGLSVVGLVLMVRPVFGGHPGTSLS